MPKAQNREQITGIDEMIARLGALPHQVERGLRPAARQGSAAGYKKGLRVLNRFGLDNGTVIGYRRWFSSVAPDGSVHLWLGENPLKRAGDFEETQSGRRRRADLAFPPGAAAAIQAEVLPEIHSAYQAAAEREIKKAIIRG